jgi:hypothetical protein
LLIGVTEEDDDSNASRRGVKSSTSSPGKKNAGYNYFQTNLLAHIAVVAQGSGEDVGLRY